MKFLLSILTLSLLLIGIARAETTLTPQAFTDAAAAAARAAMPSAQVTVTGNLHLETRSAHGEEITTDLHNAYETYLRTPERRDDIIRSYVDVLAESVTYADTKPALDRSRVVPVLKPQRWVDGARQAEGNAKADPKQDPKQDPKPEILTDPFNSELAIVYAEDRPQSLRYLMTTDDVGDRAQLRALALGNLQHMLPKIEMRQGADHIFLIEAGGNYEASLLLADGIWSSGQINVDGDIVAAVPDRSALLVTGSRNRDGIARLRKMAAELAVGPYALTPTLFVYRDGKFVKFDGD
jgi:uncharacterized protein YtpQ (UPF0354 family)